MASSISAAVSTFPRTIRELQPLLIPEDRWDTISMDFIVELPESGGYDAVMVVVDSVGKWSHFIEMVTTVTAASAANLYLCNIWKLHGLPQKVISDRGPQFVALFMKELYQLLGIEAASSTAYHSQTDGTDGTGEPRARTVPAPLYWRTTRRLASPSSIGRVLVQ